MFTNTVFSHILKNSLLLRLNSLLLGVWSCLVCTGGPSPGECVGGALPGHTKVFLILVTSQAL